MQIDQFQRIRAVFEAALERPPDERTAYVEAVCGTDAELRGEVQRLLIAHSHDPDFLENPATADASPWDLFSVLQRQGRLVGSYRLQCEIGRGGMGVVYDAVRADDAFRKRVALKIVRPEMGGEELLRRFQKEREILATLDHPNIARLLDGGSTAEGLPYLVMEFVEGQPIDEYCDSRKLNTTERLQLFRAVCTAVQYAHQNLVVHRDIKPTNILVTANGSPKLLDFGIAKLLDAQTEVTVTRLTGPGLHPLTPEYASPEQVLSRPISTATDVYSLGIVLYKLLTGVSPYVVKTRSLHEIARAICEQEPVKPSARVSATQSGSAGTGGTSENLIEVREGNPARLRRRLTGDLDNIVLKALQKDPAQRYASVEQFSEDIRRHLEGLPVLARTDTATYRLRKFAWRHRIGVSAAVLILGSMIIAVAATQRQAAIAATQAREAQSERARAEREKQLADQYRSRAEREAARALSSSREAEVQRRLAEQRARDAVMQKQRAEKQTREAHAQQQIAERRFKYARDLASALFVIFDEVKDLPGSKQARLLIAKKAEEYTQLLADDGSDSSLRDQLAAAKSLGLTYDKPVQKKQPYEPQLIDGWTIMGSATNDYRFRVDKSQFHGGRASGLIEARDDADPDGFGSLGQWFSAEEYRGKRLRMSAHVKAEDVAHWAGLWMRVDGSEFGMAFDNMQDRGIKGTRDWERYHVVLDIPTEGDAIFFGLLLAGGKGRVWLDDVNFEVVGLDVPTTAPQMKERRRQDLAQAPREPANLDFEK